MNVWFLLLVFITVGCFAAWLSINHKFGAGLDAGREELIQANLWYLVCPFAKWVVVCKAQMC